MSQDDESLASNGNPRTKSSVDVLDELKHPRNPINEPENGFMAPKSACVLEVKKDTPLSFSDNMTIDA